MQISINTVDMTAADAAALAALLAMLFPAELAKVVSGMDIPVNVTVTPTITVKEQLADKQYGVANLVKDVRAALDPADNPAAGTASAAEVFTQGAEPAPSEGLTMTATAQFAYAQYIASGWTDDALIAHGYALAPAGNAEVVSDAARVFSGGAGGPLATSSGEQHAPSNTGATSPLQSGDAMSVFAAPTATPAPSPASAPESAAATTTAHELDADGMPWDSRIHASTRTKTAKNVWKKKKGVDDGLVAQVTSELRAAVATVKAAAFVPLNATAAPSAPPPPPPPMPIAADSNAPPPPPLPASDFVAVAKFVGDYKITGDKVTQVCNAHGIAGLAMLTQHKHLCAPVLADFKKLVGVA